MIELKLLTYEQLDEIDFDNPKFIDALYDAAKAQSKVTLRQLVEILIANRLYTIHADRTFEVPLSVWSEIERMAA